MITSVKGSKVSSNQGTPELNVALDRCSEICLAEQQPIAGTAPHVDVWLMIEHRSSWAPKAPKENDLSDSFNQWLAKIQDKAEAQGLTVRPQFIRRRSRTDEDLSLFVGTKDGIGISSFRNLEDLQSIEIFDLPLDTSSTEHYFVCTHAQRDTCCSRLGIPVWQTLEAAFPGRAWHTTHLGGHRYAANVLMLMQGLMFGRMTAENVIDTVERVNAGKIPYEYLRGRSFHTAKAQFCESRLRGRYQQLLTESEETVSFLTDHGTEEVDVPQLQEISYIGSCGDTERSTTLMFV